MSIASAECEYMRGAKRKVRLKSGVVTTVNHDGLVIARARRKSGDSPLFGVLFFVAAFFLFKAFLLVSDGQEGYAERLASLQSGTTVEQAAAWAMQADP